MTPPPDQPEIGLPAPNRRAQYGDLVPQHQQFRVFRGGRAAEQDQPAAEPHEDQVEQSEGHGRPSCPTAGPEPSPQFTGLGGLLALHRRREPNEGSELRLGKHKGRDLKMCEKAESQGSRNVHR